MRGRKPFGTEQVLKLPGPEEAKRRLKALLDVTNGTLRVCEACDLLGISPQRFHDLRQEFLENSLATLVGGKPGRPRTRTEETETHHALEEEIQRLRLENEGLRVQAEVNLIVPKRPSAAEPSKKNAASEGPAPIEMNPMTNPALEPPVPCPNADPASAPQVLAGGDGAAESSGPMLSANDHFDWLRGYCHSASAPAGSAERLARVGQGRAHAVAFQVRVAEALDWTVGDTARYLGISTRTLHRWQHDVGLVATTGLLTLGRPPAAATACERRQVVDFLKAEGPGIGVPRLETHFADTDIARAEMRRLLAEFRRHWRQENQRLIHVCRWQVPGTVWAMDFTEMPVPIDGRFAHVLAIRDLASGYQLLWQPVLTQTAQPVLEALTMLFTIHGAPLVLKSDNGSAFRDGEVRMLLDRWQVFPLYSPPRTPQYNGACEASIGSLKRRTQRLVEARTAPSSEPGPDPTWTSNDLDAAQEQANAEANSRRPGPSRTQVWEARTPVTTEERARFGEAYRREEERARQEKQHPDGPLTRSQQAAVDRIALRRAMLARDYLEFRRRRISPPIPRKKSDTMR